MSFYSNNIFLVRTDRKGCISVKNTRLVSTCKITISITSSLNYRQRELVITSGSNRLSPKDTIRSFMSRMKEWGGVGLRVKKASVYPRPILLFYTTSILFFIQGVCFVFYLDQGLLSGKGVVQRGTIQGVHLEVFSFLTSSPG